MPPGGPGVADPGVADPGVADPEADPEAGARHRRPAQHGLLEAWPARWPTRMAAYCLAVLLLAAVVWLVVHALASVVTVSFSAGTALLLTALCRPLTDALERLRLPRWLASLVTVLVLVGVVGGSFYWVGRRAMDQLGDLRSATDDASGSLRDLLTGAPLHLSRSSVDGLGQQVQQAAVHALPSADAGAGLALNLLGGLVLVLFLLYCLLLEGGRMWAWAVSWSPARHRDRVQECAVLAWLVVTAYVRGSVLVALADALGIGAGMLALGNPLAVSLTLLTFLGAFVPIVGAAVSGVLAVGVTLVTVGPWSALILFGVVMLVQQVEGNLLQPLVMGRMLRLNPVAIVLSVATGGLLGGVVGAVVAVPLVAVTYRLACRLTGRDRAPCSGAPRGPSETAPRAASPRVDEQDPVVAGDR